MREAKEESSQLVDFSSAVEADASAPTPSYVVSSAAAKEALLSAVSFDSALCCRRYGWWDCFC